MSVTIKLRRGTSLEWTNSNPNVVLSLGEPGFETDTHKLKIGDGITAWNSLDYVSDGFSGVGGPLDYTYAVSYSANTFIANYDANDVINNLQINPTSHDIDFSAYYDDLIDNSYAINITLTQVEDADKAILFSCNNIVDLTSTPPYPYYSFDVIELSRSASFTGFENTKKYYLNIDIKGQNLPELTEDRIDSLIVATGGISKNYDDAANPATLTLSIDPAFLNTSLVAGSGISLDYANDELTVSASGVFQIASVDLHNGGVVTAQVLQFNDDSQQSVITGPTPPSGNSSQRIIIQGQRAQGGGEGGDVYVWGGDSDANGGDIKIYAGDADNVSPDSGYGGYVNIDGGKGANTGGNIEITAGYSAGGQAGDVEIVGGATSSGVAGDVKIKTNNYNTWTFSPDGSMTLPSGSILSETNNTLSLMPPTAVSGQSLVIRPTAAIWAISSSNYIEYGNPITIVVTLGSWAYFGTVNYTISGTGVTPQSLGRALTGKLTFVSTTGPDAESITWTIPANSNITEFTLTLTSVDGTRSIDQEVDNDPILYYDFEESNGMPIGQFITVTNNGISSSEHSHVHLVAGNPSTVDIYLGDDDQYIKIEKNAGDVIIGTNSDTNHWTFGTDGGMTFPDGSIQTTAYPGNANISTCLLHEYADPSGVSTPTSVAIDGMSYGGGQVVVDSAFGLGSSRVTLYSNSMFAMVAVDADIDTVYYNGESGSDGSGDKSLSVGVSNYRGYYSYHNLISGDDPAIQQIVISKSSIMSGSNRSIDTNNDDFTVTGLSGSDVIIVLNLYWASTDGPDNSSSTTVAIEQFIDLVMFDEATPRTNINDIRTAFYDNSATIKTAIENENSDLLFDGFEFYRSFQNVTPSGGSGSGAVLEIEVFDNGDYDDQDVLVAGTGYQVGDTLTVTGDLLGGTTPTNDVTITVNGINEAGGIIGYSVVGTSINTLWPDSYIIDGDDDQYDIGNFIGTNRTRSTAMVTLAYDPIEEDGNGGDDVFQILTILSADKTISEGQWVWFEEQNNGAFINHTLSTGGLNSSDISDFSSSVSELLPVKNVVQGSGVSVTSSSGVFTVGVSGLNSSYISDFSSSVSGLLPVVDVVQGSGINVASSSGTFTVGVSGLNSSYISDFSSSVSGLLPTIANSGDNRILTSTGTSTGINGESNLLFTGTQLSIVAQDDIPEISLSTYSNDTTDRTRINSIRYFGTIDNPTIGSGILAASTLSIASQIPNISGVLSTITAIRQQLADDIIGNINRPSKISFLTSSGGEDRLDNILSLGSEGGLFHNGYMIIEDGLSAPTPVINLGTVSGNVAINYSTQTQIQTITLNGTTINFTKGTGWTSMIDAANRSVDVFLHITVTSTTTVAFDAGLVTDWYVQPPTFIAGTYLILLRSIGTSIIQGHYISKKSN